MSFINAKCQMRLDRQNTSIHTNNTRITLSVNQCCRRFQIVISLKSKKLLNSHPLIFANSAHTSTSDVNFDIKHQSSYPELKPPRSAIDDGLKIDLVVKRHLVNDLEAAI